jgi:pyruvate ferredoxin oxidoreductase beta subunit
VKYISSASVGNIPDLEKKVAKAMENDGTSYIHIHAPCPTGRGYDPSQTVLIAREAMDCGAFELCEIINGEKKITYSPKGTDISQYHSDQKRFGK